MPAISSFLIHLFLVVALVSVTHSVNNHVRDHDDTHFFSFSPSPPLGLFSCFVFVFVFFFSKTVRIEWSIRSLLRALVHVTMNVDSRQNKKARKFMFFCSYIIQLKPVLLWFIFLLSWLFIYFIVKSFMVALTLQVPIRCEEDGIALHRGKIFLCVSSWIKCKLQYFLYFYVVRRGNLYICMGGRYLLIGHCFLKWLVALKRAVLLVVFG